MRFSKFLQISVCCLGLAACASSSSSEYTEDGIYDPFESYNRGVFAVNDALDQAILKPVATGYKKAVPEPVRDGAHNFLVNLRAPVNLANELLQGDLDGAGKTVTRTLINTTVGVGGLFDVAGHEGMEYEHEDFGQTLAVWGVDHGPYVVIPLMGPSSFRDATGLLVDSLADPLRIYLFNVEKEGWHYARVGMTALDTRTELLGSLEDLRKNSYDYYAAMRSSYYQYREAMVNDHDADKYESPEIPDYDDDFSDL